MTAHELARKLLELPDVMVTVRGYEGGVDIAEYVSEPKPIHINAHDEWYYGKHEYCGQADNYCSVPECNGLPSILAIQIG